MSFKNRPVRTEFAYGGVPEDMAYGFAHGGRLVGAPQKNSIFGNTNNEDEDSEHHETVRETLERVFNDVNAKEQNNLTNTATTGIFDNNNYSDTFLSFDGKKLDWNENGNVAKSWSAMSGKKDYQCRNFTNVTDNGPIPEGEWIVKQSQLQNYDDLPIQHKIAGPFGMGWWKGGKTAWGKHRIWLEPSDGTDNLGRVDLSIHGGSFPGSSGCIDLTDGMDDFTKDFKRHNQDMRLKVKYPKKCW